MARKNEFDPKFTPVDLVAEGRESLSVGECELKRVDCASGSCGEQTLMLVFRPARWSYSLTVDLGEDVPEFTAATPWEEILKNPVDSKFMWLGKSYRASIRLDRDGTAVVTVHEPLTAKTFRKTPFASFRVALDGAGEEKPEVPGAVYAVSVASFCENSGELASHCAAFATPEKAADWFETDWNDQAAYYGGRKLTEKAKKAFLDALKGKDGVAEAESPAGWGDCWFKWKGIRTEI